ncbi:MAG: trypsin-like peptidase domain-containing protein, partial [bacterium]
MVVSCVLLTSASLAGDQGPTPPVEPTVGYGQPYEVIPDLSSGLTIGEMTYWTTFIYFKDASFVKAHLTGVNLRKGDVLTLYSRTGETVEEIVGRGPGDRETFWALSAFGDELHLEFAFAHPYSYVPFRVDHVISGFPGLFSATATQKSICSPADFDDVICYQSDGGKWSNVMASVGVMSVGGDPVSALWCSGSNVSPLNYLLTNAHCITSQGDCDNSEFVFKYYRTACNTGAPPTTDWQSFRCDQLVAQSPYVSCDAGLNDLDFSLCSVIGDPAATFGFVRPDPVPLTDGENIYIIQHPAGRPHEIAHGGGSDVDVDGTVLRYYDTLDTEGGSSGSPIFREADDMLVGLHHCGGCDTAGVGNRGMLMSDIYPHIVPYLCSPTVDVIAIGYENLAEVSGNGDAILDPGETWKFWPRVTNNACSTAAIGLSADLQVNGSSVPVILLDLTVSFGDVPGSQSATSLAPVRFEINAAAPCGGDVVLDLVNLTATNAGPFPDSPGYLDEMVGEFIFDTLLREDFSGGLGAWTIVDGGTGSGAASTWTTANPGGRILSLLSPFAIADSDELGTGQTMDEQMISPVIDASGFVSVQLQFNHDFYWYAGGQDERGSVAVRSSATGGAWVPVITYSGASFSGMESLDISAQAAGQSDTQIRFHYYNAVYEWWWAVDDILVVGSGGAVCRGPFFTSYGSGCAGSTGYTPTFEGSGTAVPGGSVTFTVANGEPGSAGFALISASQNLVGCLLVLPPFEIHSLPLDGTGTGHVGGTVPAGMSPDTHAYLQWIGRASA